MPKLAIDPAMKPRDDNATGPVIDPTADKGYQVARKNWLRFQYCASRGHDGYCREAKRDEDYYLGGGLQWSPEDRLAMEPDRPCTENNEILGSVNSALGYQIANRMDVQAVARGHGANEQTAKVISMVYKAELDRVRYRWLETDVFADGMIQQRGYYDLRISTENNLAGEIAVTVPDPMDVIPDPDAKSYNPDDWHDVRITRWMTADEIGEQYGDKARAKLLASRQQPDQDFGEGADSDDVPRSRFGDSEGNVYPDRLDEGGVTRWRVVDTQTHVRSVGLVAIYPTGDVVALRDGSDEGIEAAKATTGVVISKRRTKRVRWTVSTSEVLLHDDWSPYRHFTIIPFYPYFRRGRTRGMVDNAISPQNIINKGTSQALVITNSTANSGWIYDQGSLAEMESDSLETDGAKPGLNIVVKPNARYPQKITPNPIPDGIIQMVSAARETLRSATGINASMRGDEQQDMSGVAIQSRQFAAQQQLAMPLDNLSRTRHLFAQRCLELFQSFYTDPREFRFTEHNGIGGEPVERSAVVNQPSPENTGGLLHDLTVGKYDLAVSAQPMQITFDNSQFEQMKAMRKDMGVHIPDRFVIQASNLTDKAELVRATEQEAQAAAQSPPISPVDQAKAASLSADAQLKAANAELVKANTVNTKVTAMYSATRSAAEVAALPALTPVADEMLASAGFVDNNAPPVIPQPTQEGPAPPPGPTNTDPLTPPHPDVGINAGIRAPANGLSEEPGNGKAQGQ